jgi:cell wall-associated NlpC family hydrolase
MVLWVVVGTRALTSAPAPAIVGRIMFDATRWGVGWCAAAAAAVLLAGCASPPRAAAPATTGADPITDWLARRGELAPHAPRPMPDDAGRQRAGALVLAMAYVGVPYRRGGTDFDQGVDCSGFVQSTFREGLGIALPRTAAEQAQATRPIGVDALEPGDLVFFNTLGRPYSHVGIYVGQGRFVHSPRPGAQVRLERLDGAYWRARFDGARRVDVPSVQARAE